MDWEVVEVKPELPLSLYVRFQDGTTGKVRIEPSYLTGVFTVLQDQRVFEQVYVEGGAVAWPGELDLAPDAMHEEIKSHGEMVLR
ncbi:DUF2442 domain-containing protein [soil metagenome]